jgi:Protein of unknown function (DUF3223)
MNKKQKAAQCKQILNKYAINTIVTDTDDIQFLISIFENHSDWNKKNGNGVSSISVILSKYKNRCFQLNRIDSTITDISYFESISNKSPLLNIKNACRNAIYPIIVEFRKENISYGISKCPISGDILTKQNTHIDHYDLTFDEMFKQWLKDKNVDELFSKINESQDNSFETFFTDNSIIEDFRNFHNANSKLRAVSKFTNLSTLKYFLKGE